MNDRELYQSTFSQVHASRPIVWEDFENMKTSSVRRPPRSLMVLAALLCLLAVLTGAALAVNFLGLRDLLLPRKQQVRIIDPETGLAVPGQTQQVDSISLSGFMDSPESKALAEWQDFLAGYDRDHAILDRVGNYLDPMLDKYLCYYVYTQDMADKLEEIAAKYGLNLHTRQIDLSAHPEALGTLAGFGRGSETYWTYLYEDGGCHFDGCANVEGWGLVDVQFQRSVKGTFNEVILTIEDVSAYQEWTYQTACGLEVLLAISPGRSLIVADLPDSFVVFNVLIGSDGEMTRARLEGVADCYDLTLLTPVEVPALEEQTVRERGLDSPRQAYANALWELWGGGVFPDGTQAAPDSIGNPGNEFALYDVDFDGSEELILLYTATYTAGMKGYVVDFDPDYEGPGAPLRVQLLEFPALTFYENGAVKADWSHNQTWGELWPYVLYGYEPESDSYSQLASVYTADRALLEEAGKGEEYPAGADLSGSGTVYYVTFPSSGEQIWDREEYQSWLDSVLGRAQPLDLPCQPLTEENIQALSDSPLPILPHPMPAG